MPTTQVTITVNTIGADCGPFTITDNVLGTIASGVTRSNLLDGYIVNADENATSVTVTSTGVCVGTNLAIGISPIVCPPPPAPEYGYYLAHFYPCDGFCASTEDVTVAFDYAFSPNYAKWYAGDLGIYRVYDVASAPYDVYLSDTTEYNSCLLACAAEPPPPTYEWYELIDCNTASVIYSQAQTPGSFSLNERVTNVAETYTYYITNTFVSNPGGIQIAIVTTGLTYCPASPPPTPPPSPGGSYYYTVEAWECFPCTFLGFGYARASTVLVTDIFYNNGDGNVYKITGYAAGPGYDVDLDGSASDAICSYACSI